MDISNYKYLGFGGYKFYDFEMLFRHLGIQDMVSIERDADLFGRCVFNKPFEFIEFVEGDLQDFLTASTFSKPLVAWLDFDSPVSKETVGAILAVGAKLPADSFVFATLDARMPESYRDYNVNERRAELQNELEGYALIQRDEDLEIDNFPILAERIAWAALTGSLSRRVGLSYLPLVRVFYKDSAPMLTVGAALCSADRLQKLRSKIAPTLSFLAPDNSAPPYTIPPFNLTQRERYLLDKLATGSDDSGVRKQLVRIGIDDVTIDEYKRVIRFIPKYVETYL